MKKLLCFSSLQRAVLSLCIIDGLGALLLFGLLIQTFHPAIVETFSGSYLDIDFIVTFIFSIGALLTQLLLASVLFYGAKHNKRKPCRIWLCVSTLLFILKVIIVLVHLVTGNHDIISYGLLVDSLYKLYQGLVVVAFINTELDEEGDGMIILHKKCSANEISI